MKRKNREFHSPFADIVQRYNDPLFLFLCSLVQNPDEAADLLQDTFYDAWQATCHKSPSLDTLPDPDVHRWLFRVGYHRAIDWLRRQKKFEWQPLELIADTIFDVEDAAQFVDRIAEQDVINKAMMLLAPPDRACLLLMVVHDLSLAETAQILEISCEACRKRLYRAKQRLLEVYRLEVSIEEVTKP